MLFNSLGFLLFFPVVVLLYYIVPDRWKHYWLLLASYFFYMSWNAKYALLILFSTSVTYLCAILLEKGKNRGTVGKRRLIVLVSIILNLSMLAYFKYFNFLLSTVESVFALCHVQLHIPEFDILLPVGISFFTFQALGYTIDVYRGDTPAEHNFFRYALFVSFFPQLVAGPIERSGNLMSQLAVPHRFSFEQTKEGLLLMLWGYFLKIVLADHLAPFINMVYGDVTYFNGWYSLLATILFAFQIYCDFYGYSVIAMGAAKILGIRLMENFDAPYLSTSVAEFWRRWHISLTSWFRDYLYIPLGGSRKGKVRKYLNVLIVFLISGLWHGASFTFVVWGAFNGIFQIIGEILMPLRRKAASLLHLHRESFVHRTISCVITFILVDFSWIFFRAANFRDAAAVVRQILSPGDPALLITEILTRANPRAAITECLFVFLCLLLLALADIMKRCGIALRYKIMAQDAWFQSLFFVAAVCGILVFGVWGSSYQEASFIYFQF